MGDEKQPAFNCKNTLSEVLSSMNVSDNSVSSALKSAENSLQAMKSAFNLTHPNANIKNILENYNDTYKQMSAPYSNMEGALGDAIKNMNVIENLKPSFSSEFMKAYDNLKSYTDSLDGLTGTSSEAKSIIRRAKEQRALIDDIYDGSSSEKYLKDKVSKKEQHLSASPPYINPVYETNDKLASIEQRFEKMLEVMVTAASIGNTIQANAASFIEKFEIASQQTDASARQAIRIGIIAICIAILMPLVPMGIGLFLTDPTVAAIEALSREVTTSQQTQNDMMERLVTEFRDGDETIVKGIAVELRASKGETNDLLRGLIKQLTEKPKESLPLPQP